MDPSRRNLLLLIGLGGAAVLGSYVLAFAFSPAIRSELWGGVPDALRGLYTVNMLLAALGFFPITWLLGFATPADRLVETTGLSFRALLAAYAAILIPSALWLPLTALHLHDPSVPLWWAIRIVLFAVGLAATILGWMAIRRAREGPPLAWLVVLAFFPFWLQTMVLDAIVWPAYFPS